MSVLVNDRKESKFEAITFATELHDMLIDLMQRGFGIRDLEHFVRLRYAYGKDPKEDFAKYRFLMQNAKQRIDQTAALLAGHLRAAYSIYPSSMAGYYRRRAFQNLGIADCEQLIKEIQDVVRIFEVDINVLKRYIKAIDREIDLIKKWRQRDNKIKSYLQG